MRDLSKSSGCQKQRNVAVLWLRDTLFDYLKAHPVLLAKVVCALLLLSLVNGALVLVLGPLLKLILNLGADEQIHLGQLWGANAYGSGTLHLDYVMTYQQVALYLPILLGLIAIGRSIFMYLYQKSQQELSLGFAFELRQRVFGDVIVRDFVDASKITPSQYMSVLMNDVTILQTRFAEVGMHMLRDIFMLISAWVALMFLSYAYGLVFLLAIPAFVWVLGKGGSGISRYADLWQSAVARMADVVYDFRNREEFIFAQRGQATEVRLFRRWNHAYLKAVRKSLWIRSTLAPSVELLGFLVVASLLTYILGGDAASGSHWGGAVPTLALLGAIGLSVKPMRGIGEHWTTLADAIGVAHRVHSLTCQQRSGLDSAANSFAKPQFSARWQWPLVIEQSSWTWSGSNRDHNSNEQLKVNIALRIQNLRIDAQRIYGVMGASGCGKSTLLKGLSGLLQPVDWGASMDARLIAISSVYLSQFPFLFKASLRENLSYGLENFDFSDVEILAKVLKISDAVEALPKSWDTIVDPLKWSWSGGQMQRLCLLRCLLRPAKLYLLDEPFSAIEPALEAEILTWLRSWVRVRDCAIVIASHHQTIDYYDQLWRFERQGILGS